MLIRWERGPPRGGVVQEMEEVGFGEALSNNRPPKKRRNGGYGRVSGF